MSITVVYDATHNNIGHLPSGASYAGYVTGSGGVAWTAADFARFPDAVRIDQTPASGQWDGTADVDDYERGAVSLNELAGRALERLASFKIGSRPGQRSPVVYFSATDIHAVVNALVNGGVQSGVGLWVANWNLSQPETILEVTSSAGPFPIVAGQFHNAGAFDISVFSTAWLTNRSHAPVPVPPPHPVKADVPPGQWNDPKLWTWATAALVGTGQDKLQHQFSYDPATGKWRKVLLSDRYQAGTGPACLRGRSRVTFVVKVPSYQVEVPNVRPQSHSRHASRS